MRLFEVKYLIVIGILAAKKHLFVNPVPSHCGGGTVLTVSWTISALLLYS